MTLVRFIPASQNRTVRDGWNVPVDIIEKSDGFSLVFDAPGFNKDDLKIKVHENLLTVSGERKQAEDNENSYFTHYERPSGQFSRTFRLPEYADGEHVKATYEQGVLTLKIDKKEEAKPRTIEIK